MAFRQSKVLVPQMTRTDRKARNPAHSWNTAQKAWGVQPIVIAPVLPGETLASLEWQCRSVTDPVKNPIGGWWCEHYFFYVKHRQLPQTYRDYFMGLMLNPAQTPPAAPGSNQAKYLAPAGIGVQNALLQAVVEAYFRDEGESVSISDIASLPCSSYGRLNFAESLLLTSDMPDDVITAGEALTDVEKAWETWEYLRTQRLTQMTYEDWLRTFGVQLNQIGYELPELIRMRRHFQYPSNTINPATGAPTSAVSWVVQEKASKRRFFNEPGFIFGVQVFRPKVYYGNQLGAMSQFLNRTESWMPALMWGNPESTLREFADDANGPYGANMAGSYWLDERDLYLYGDQFITHISGAADGARNIIDQPTNRTTSKYPTEADSTALFVTAGTEQIRTDGICQLRIMGVQEDHT